MNKQLSIIAVLVLVLGIIYAFAIKPFLPRNLSHNPDTALAARFDYLSRNGNSSCSATFRDSIQSLSDDARLQGSCCSLMNMHRYSEQVEGLKEKYNNIPEIPPDPYDIKAGLAKMLMSHYNDALTSDEQEAYNYAMEHSDEKGPCCCKCWRWNAYGGLAKVLITKYKFTGEQITDVWNLSDGCGGDEHEH